METRDGNDWPLLRNEISPGTYRVLLYVITERQFDEVMFLLRNVTLD